MVKSLSWITAILLMILIFYFSQQPITSSSHLSTRITERITEVIKIVVPIDDVPVYTIHHLVRKSAHFFLYFFLSIVVLIALKKSGVRGYRNVILSFLLCMIYAITDEVHQIFVTGRGAHVKDVLIDGSGAAIGILIASISISKVKRRNTRSKQMPNKNT